MTAGAGSATVDAPHGEGHALAREGAGGCASISELSVRDFRNLERADVALPAEGVALVGDNGHGKTNFLEAIYYLQLLRSFRGARDQDLVRFGEQGFHLSAVVDGGRHRRLSVGFERASKRKRVALDGAEAERVADALGVFPAVIFSPLDAVLVSGAPTERRRFLDVILSLTSRRYLSALQRYRAALAHRNAALRDAGGGTASVEQSVAVWEPALASHGAVLVESRRAWVAQHHGRFAELCGVIGERGAARLRYLSAHDADEDVENALRSALEQKRPLDLRRGMTHAGPHRDDLELALDGRDLRTYGSAGQQRTAAIALRLLEAATLRSHAAREPVVLLDDPFAELDNRRAALILELLDAEGRGQTILAVPRGSDIPRGLTRLERWRIVDGALSREAA